MAHEIETTFYTGEVPWHGLGVHVEEAPTSADALIYAGLDWEVVKRPMDIRLSDGTYIESPVFANIRNTDNAFFGSVSDRYKIVQNKEAFAFTDLLLQNDFGIPVTYETAGSLFGGKRVWMLAKLPLHEILGDKIVPYIVITNTFDGKGAVKVAMTPTRVVCNNTLTLGLANATRTWSTKHAGNMEAKIRDAEDTLNLAQEYMKALTEKADVMQQEKIRLSEVNEILEQIWPTRVFGAERANMNNMQVHNNILEIYKEKEDLQKFENTKWGFYNAVADWESHVGPRKVAPSFQERKFASFIDGSTKLSVVEELLAAV
jgi:phage/plasmid-like protein (TIGR03299 family)